MNKNPCTNCGETGVKGQWWYLSNYYGLNGRFCCHCFELVAHKCSGEPREPRHPKKYKAILAKQLIASKKKKSRINW